MTIKNLRGPTKAICTTDFFAAVECRTVVSHNSPKKTGQDVECSLERGLLCKGQCFDYEMRVYCECNELTVIASSPKPTTPYPTSAPKTVQTISACNPSIPNVEHPSSCSKFLQCVMSPSGSHVYIESTCGDTMLFNPKAMVCDWPTKVMLIKPECKTLPEKPIKFQRECPDGYVYSECSIPCNRACHYYDKILTGSGNCTRVSNDCIPGCVPSGAVLKCDYPKLYRDMMSCVDIQSCTCIGPYGEMLRPGQVVTVSDCKTCQCLNNEYICANVPCGAQQASVIASTIRPVEGVPVTLPLPSIENQIKELPHYITVCDPSIPHVEHPKSCYKFLHCVPKADGSFIYAEKTCYPDMMYNPKAMVCDWPASVMALKPKCGVNPGEIEIWETEETFIQKTRISTTKRPLLVDGGSQQPPTTFRPQTQGQVGQPATTFRPSMVSPGVTKPIDELERYKLPEYIKVCDPSIPHIEHPKSCYKFLHCTPSLNGSFIYAVKTCYPDMMFNPKHMICDWPASVQAIKPNCRVNPGEIEIWETEVIEIVTNRRKITTTKKPPPVVSELGTSGEVDTFTGEETQSYVRYCNPSSPIVEHPKDCHKFIACTAAPNGSFVATLKTCGPEFMFSPATSDCTWPDVVVAEKPSCREEMTTPPSAPFTIPPGIFQTQAPKVLPTTLTPPMQCYEAQMIPLMNLLPDYAITASSILGANFGPENARLESKPNDKSSGSWSPKTNDLNQFLQVTFSQAVPIYGVVIKGNPMFDQYVTSFKVLHSFDGSIYHVYEDVKKRLQIFSGSVDSKTSVKTIFHTPIEAKIVRIYPISWHSSIALRAEIIGCQKYLPPVLPFKPATPSTTFRPGRLATPPGMMSTTQSPMFTEKYVEVLCDDPLGVENGQLSSGQIKFSSIKDAGSVKTKVRKNALETIKLSSIRGWMPLADSTGEYILVRVPI